MTRDMKVEKVIHFMLTLTMCPRNACYQKFCIVSETGYCGYYWKL